jgi:hypothetical protein
LLRDLRRRGERGFALLTQRWAALFFTQFEHKYIS